MRRDVFQPIPGPTSYAGGMYIIIHKLYNVMYSKHCCIVSVFKRMTCMIIPPCSHWIRKIFTYTVCSNALSYVPSSDCRKESSYLYRRWSSQEWFS